ncbi:LysR family transcriptional regulator [Prosthecomicrobium hirschii]|uniref:LysR family transcriptional regulator n=1 Tax=Prosthecodimorpha hirschii TaxID=665126 RepID=UPI0022203FA3|nr:LysR family transcriptional regulator [Prosthecomicrobium hirschii]MCW1838577.1 LysR family transcriptional regulator [Prosthecomicrobium hirschii]
MTMALRNLDLNLLVSLEALLAERNVTRAARRLGLSQPALSGQLARLREMFDDPLLIAGPRGMIPSARALALQEPLTEQLAGLADLLALRSGFVPETDEATFRIAASDSMQAVFGVVLLARIAETAPNTRVALIRPVAATIARQMAEGEIDVLITPGKWIESDWQTRPILEERFVCVTRDDHPAARRPLDLDTFCALDHLLVSPVGGGFSGVVDDALAAIGRSRRVTVSIQDFLVAPPLLACTDLIATVPSRVLHAFGPGFAALEPPIDLAGFTAVAAWHPRTHRDPAQQWLREQIADVAAHLDEAIAECCAAEMAETAEAAAPEPIPG